MLLKSPPDLSDTLSCFRKYVNRFKGFKFQKKKVFEFLKKEWENNPKNGLKTNSDFFLLQNFSFSKSGSFQIFNIYV